FKVNHGAISESFGEQYLPFEDPDGLKINLIVSKTADDRKPWETAEVIAANATKGFHNIVLTLNNIKATAAVLTEVFGYTLLATEGNRHRYATDAIGSAAIVDLLEVPGEPRGINSAGTNHHIAFRVKDEETLMEFRKKIVERGLNI